ncbi:alanine--tRNA ligase, partial [Microvirga sp. 3-52]|nr:alanine--tRNA ligase [Microvirga sp. 3-52]
IELCGGCHVDTTGSIGLFKLVSESGIGAGTRRIEALTGPNAYRAFKEEEALLEHTAELLKSNPRDLVKKVESLLGELKALQSENESLSSKLANSQLSEVFETAEQIGDVTVVASRVEVKDNNALRQMMDEMK